MLRSWRDDGFFTRNGYSIFGFGRNRKDHNVYSCHDCNGASVYFRLPSRKVSDWVANELGECEIEQTEEGVSYGANTIRDGVSLNSHRIKRNVILSSEIMTLNNLEAFLKLAGIYPVCKIKLDYIDRPAKYPSFIPMKFNQQQQKEQQTISSYIEKCIQQAPAEVKSILSTMGKHPLEMQKI